MQSPRRTSRRYRPSSCRRCTVVPVAGADGHARGELRRVEARVGRGRSDARARRGVAQGVVGVERDVAGAVDGAQDVADPRLAGVARRTGSRRSRTGSTPLRSEPSNATFTTACPCASRVGDDEHREVEEVVRAGVGVVRVVRRDAVVAEVDAEERVVVDRVDQDLVLGASVPDRDALGVEGDRVLLGGKVDAADRVVPDAAAALNRDAGSAVPEVRLAVSRGADEAAPDAVVLRRVRLVRADENAGLVAGDDVAAADLVRVRRSRRRRGSGCRRCCRPPRRRRRSCRCSCSSPCCCCSFVDGEADALVARDDVASACPSRRSCSRSPRPRRRSRSGLRSCRTRRARRSCPRCCSSTRATTMPFVAFPEMTLRAAALVPPTVLPEVATRTPRRFGCATAPPDPMPM